MEWTNRNSNDNSAAPAQSGAATSSAARHRADKSGVFKGLRLATVALLFSVTILIAALAWFVAIGGNTSGEGKYVDDKRMQAVFLNGGQVYFGHITNLSEKYMRVEDIYYLRVNQQVQPNQENGQQQQANDISLVKLGCELHGPEDNMLINREQVIFWENLKVDGQVAKAVAEYKQKNPEGQKCETPSQNTTTTPPTNPTPTTPTPPTTPNNNTNRR